MPSNKLKVYTSWYYNVNWNKSDKFSYFIVSLTWETHILNTEQNKTDIKKTEIYLMQYGRGTRDEERRGESRREWKRTEKCYIHVPTPGQGV